MATENSTTTSRSDKQRKSSKTPSPQSELDQLFEQQEELRMDNMLAAIESALKDKQTK